MEQKVGHTILTVSPNRHPALEGCQERGFTLALLSGKNLGNHSGPTLFWSLKAWWRACGFGKSQEDGPSAHPQAAFALH